MVSESMRSFLAQVHAASHHPKIPCCSLVASTSLHHFRAQRGLGPARHARTTTHQAAKMDKLDHAERTAHEPRDPVRRSNSPSDNGILHFLTVTVISGLSSCCTRPSSRRSTRSTPPSARSAWTSPPVRAPSGYATNPLHPRRARQCPSRALMSQEYLARTPSSTCNALVASCRTGRNHLTPPSLPS